VWVFSGEIGLLPLLEFHFVFKYQGEGPRNYQPTKPDGYYDCDDYQDYNMAFVHGN